MLAVLQHLSALALRPVLEGAAQALGLEGAGNAAAAVVGFVAERWNDPSQRLPRALAQAQERAWKALEIALAGDSFWERCRGLLAAGETKGVRQQLQSLLDGTELSAPLFRADCLRELRAARKAGLLDGFVGANVLAAATAFLDHADPPGRLDAEWQLLEHLSGALREYGHPNLARLVSLRTDQGLPLLVLLARYFFRRAVEEDSALFQGLTLAQLDKLQAAQEEGLAALYRLMEQQNGRLEEMLAEVQVVVVETHGAVLDIQEELSRQTARQGERHRDLYNAVLQLQRRLDLLHSEVRPRDSLSIRSETERQMVKEVVGRYRRLPEEQRRELPALLNAIGKLEVAAGDFQAAEHDFATVARLVQDPPSRGAAHVNTYRVALERRDWDRALHELVEAVRLDGRRYAPFPVGKYHPKRILGAGGFGVAFLCRHKELQADVVVKALLHDYLEREVDQVFAEAQVLWQLDHPAIIRLLDCGYCLPAGKARPYVVMHYFDGLTLEEHVRQKGPLGPEDLVEVARLMAGGLQAAHTKGILHRDIKPANVLLRRVSPPLSPLGRGAGGEGPLPPLSPLGRGVGGEGEWQVKLIDFGLAVRPSALRSPATSAYTLHGRSLAGSVDYAAPEQMGRLPGVPVSPASDVYGFGRTCCYALFQTPQPRRQHWRRLPEALADLLDDCLAEKPEERPEGFAVVAQRLARAFAPDVGAASRAAPGAAPARLAGPAGKCEPVPLDPLNVEIDLGGPTPEARLEAVRHAIGQLEAATHPALRTGHEALVRAEQRWQRLCEEAREQPPVLTQEVRERLVQAIRREPAPTLAELGDLVPTLSPAELAGHVECFRRVEQARQALKEGQARFEKMRQDKLAEVRQLAVRVEEERAELEAWQQARAEGTREAYSRFLCAFPHGPHAAHVDDRCWQMACEVNTLQAYTGYLKSLPRGRHAAEALRFVSRLRGESQILLHNLAGSRCAVFSPDGAWLVTGSPDGQVRVWDAGSGVARAILKGHQGTVTRVAWSPDGWSLASASADGTIKVWNASDGLERLTLHGHRGLVYSVAFSPDGNRLLSASTDKTIQEWDPATGMSLRTFRGHTGYVYQACYSPDGTKILSGSEDGTVRIWDVIGERRLATLQGHTGPVYSVAWSPDGQLLASASWDNTVKLRQAGTGEVLHTIYGHLDDVRGVLFSPDGSHFLSVGNDGAVKLWRSDNGQLALTLKGHNEPVCQAAFSGDGARLASASAHEVRLWALVL